MRAPRLSRRTFLRGAGAALALPWLEQMAAPLVPGGVRRAEAGGPPDAPGRFVLFFIPCGVPVGWAPAAEGADYAMPAMLAALEPFRRDLLVLSGVDNASARESLTAGGPHSAGTMTFSTATPAVDSGAGGPSIDRVVAQLDTTTRLAGVAVNNESPNTLLDAEGITPRVLHDLSWDAAARSVPALSDPRALYERLFVVPGADVLARRRGVIDAVRADANALGATLGAADARRLSEYLDSLRDVERSLDYSRAVPAALAAPDPRVSPDMMAAPDRAALMLQMVTLALRTDVTRSVSFGLANAGSSQTFPWLDIHDQHHALSHRVDDEAIAMLTRIVTYEVGVFASFLQQLRDAQEGDHTLLDRTAVLLTSEVADGAAHTYESLPLLLAGSAGGRLATGRHARLPAGTPLAAVHATVLAALGADSPRFGADQVGPIPSLLA